ncbi:membrane protein [Rugosimonospora africana]|uniref:Membrane protein n=1 Tax=Rugosimonospora africana TaxID=556532 RepID=A0A8J3VMA3_9ACTN|nr:membrane protein [Rugosimonospora africana]
MLCATAMTILGTSFPVSRELTGYPTLTSQAVRYLIAAALLAALVRRSAGRAPYRRELLRLAGLAATGLAAFNVCVLAALRHADPAVLGTVIGGTPLLLAILGPVLAGSRASTWAGPVRRRSRRGAPGRRRPSARVVGCGAVVVAGIALVQGGGHASAAGLCWALGALAGEVLFSLLAAPLLDELGPVRVSAWACALAVPQLAVAALVTGEWHRLRVPTAAEGVALLYLAVVLTVVAFLCWYGGLRRLGVERAGMFAGLLPVASLAGTAVIDHTAPAPGALLGTLVVAAGLGAGLAVDWAGPSATATDQAPVPVGPVGSEPAGAAPVEEARSAARTRSA